MAFKYAASTVMMPEFRPEQAARILKELGYDGVEWRVHALPVVPEKVLQSNLATLNIETIIKDAADIRSLCHDNGLDIIGLGTYLSYKFLDEIEMCMEAAKIMDCPSIRVSPPLYSGSLNYNDLFEEAIEGYEKVEGLAKQYKVRANVEIHNGNICSSASLAYKFVSNFDPDYVGVIYDPGNMVCEGYENWQLGLELLGPYLSHVHVKNMAWVEHKKTDNERVWRTSAAPMNEGFVPWRWVMHVLDKVGYEGWLSLEDFSNSETRVKLSDDIRFLKSIENDLVRSIHEERK
ncbi:sugar phosphate isomerase/epimerase [bacterium]|nr:sugar phosphate isomerase/epimerase [bacterium]